MPKRVFSRTKNSRRRTSEFSLFSDGGMFESRPFVVQSKVGEEAKQPDFKTSVMRAERYGHHLGQIHSSPGTTIQLAKLPQREQNLQRRELKQQESKIVKLKTQVDGMCEGIEDKNQLKQYSQIQENLREAIENYKILSIEQKLQNSDKLKGTVAYIESKLTTLNTRSISKGQPTQKEKQKQEWSQFEEKVHQGWTNFKNSGWSRELRGVNNEKEYKAPDSVIKKIRKAKGSITINGGIYKISNSNTAGVSLHREIPKSSGVVTQGFESYIFHL